MISVPLIVMVHLIMAKMMEGSEVISVTSPCFSGAGCSQSHCGLLSGMLFIGAKLALW